MYRVKIVWVLCVHLLFTGILLAHKQHVHQYFAREGYNLLRLHYGSDVPQMSHKIGTHEGYFGSGPWSTGLVVDGAWLEDQYDPVWEWSEVHRPTVTGLSGVLLDAFATAFGGLPTPDPFVSSTHFWNVDNGDNLASDLEGTFRGVHFLFTVANAYQKLLYYANGYWVINWKAPDFIRFQSPNGHTYEFRRQFLEVPLNITFYYTSLSDLYKSRLITLYRTLGSNYRTYDVTLGRYVEYQGTLYLSDSWRDNFVWEILGRMIHLLTDQSVPAHTRCDIHGSIDNGIRQDSYEQWYGYQFQAWDAQTVYNQSGGPFIPYDYQDPLHFLMYTTAQFASYFGTNGAYNGDGNGIIAGDPRSDEIAYLQSIFPTLLTNIDGYDIRAMRGDNEFTENIKTYIRDKTLPHTVRATAGLLYWFAMETDLLSNTLVRNNFGGGTVRVNGASRSSGYRTPAWGSPSPITLEAIDQVYNGCNYRFSRWRKLVSGRQVQTWPA